VRVAVAAAVSGRAGPHFCRRIDESDVDVVNLHLLVSGDAATVPVIDNGLLFAEPLALPGGHRMHLSDHVALTARIGLPPTR
jgi:hypothetical protein